MAKATTVRFTEEVYARLDQASSRTGLPVNSIVIAACLDWLQRYTPNTIEVAAMSPHLLSPDVLRQGSVMKQGLSAAPRWATLRRAVELAGGKLPRTSMYPFDRFSDHAKELLTLAQAEAEKWGHSYIGTEHLLLASFDNPDFHSARVLAALGIQRDRVSAAIERAIGAKTVSSRSRLVPTSRTKKVIELAFELCGNQADSRVGTHHLLWALAAEGNGIGAHVLADLGVKQDHIALEMAKVGDRER